MDSFEFAAVKSEALGGKYYIGNHYTKRMWSDKLKAAKRMNTHEAKQFVENCGMKDAMQLTVVKVKIAEYDELDYVKDSK